MAGETFDAQRSKLIEQRAEPFRAERGKHRAESRRCAFEHCGARGKVELHRDLSLKVREPQQLNGC